MNYIDQKVLVPDTIKVHGIGLVSPDSSFLFLQHGGSGIFEAGKDGVKCVLLTADKKVEFIVYEHKTLAFVRSALGQPAIYPLTQSTFSKPAKAVLMDLDGTSVRSEEFWIWIIEQTIASLKSDVNFQLEESDLPFVSGHSVSEHLQYCINKYCPGKSLEDARTFYFEHTRREMHEITLGRGRANAFHPVAGLKEFLLKLKDRKIRIGLVTSGLYEKAWPEVLAAFRQMNMGDPLEFYDAIISAGNLVGRGSVGTLGELAPKPHPWLYSETALVGLNIQNDERKHVIGIEDSGAGVVSVRLAGFSCIGMAGGNISVSGTKSLLIDYCEDFNEASEVVF